jgi:hypothetical protein
LNDRLDEIVGIIYFKSLTAGTTRQGVTSGNTLFNPTGLRSWDTNASYSSNYIYRETGDEAVKAESAGDLVSAHTLNNLPVMKGSVTVEVMDSDGSTVHVTATDDRAGGISGYNTSNGISLVGTINYTTGVVALTLGGSTGILAEDVDYFAFSYDVDMESDPTAIPQLSWNLTDATVRAEQFLLEGQWGVITEFVLNKRFGKAMDVEIANDLKAEINAEVGATAIQKMYAAMQGTNTWSATPPSGTSAYEHRMMMRDIISDAGNTISGNAGKGKVSYLICGNTALTYLRSQPGWSELQSGDEIGPHIVGMLDKIVVIKAGDTNLVPAAEMIAGYRGANWFESGVVYAPYLPLAVIGPHTVGSSLHKASGAVHVAAVHVAVDDFITKISLSNT